MTLNITILGLDPLGSALGLAFGTLDPKVLDVGRPKVTGWDADRKRATTARGRLAIDTAAPDPAAAVREADVVFVNTAEAELRQTFAAIAPHLKNGVIVTDTASVKAPVMAIADELLPPTAQFIGGHAFVPFDALNVENPKPDVLQNVIYCLVATPDTSSQALNGLSALVTAIGAKPYFMDALEHDSYAAGAAHLPLLAAVALMETVSKSPSWPELQPIAGEALIGSTALASSEPQAVANALHSNRVALRHWIDGMQRTLNELNRTLDDPLALAQLAERSAQAREQWLSSTPNVRPGEADTYSGVRDIQNTNLTGLFFGRRAPRPKKR